jgi:hypothetical protein
VRWISSLGLWDIAIVSDTGVMIGVALVAQWIERIPAKNEVESSILSGGTPVL